MIRLAQVADRQSVAEFQPRFGTPVAVDVEVAPPTAGVGHSSFRPLDGIVVCRPCRRCGWVVLGAQAEAAIGVELAPCQMVDDHGGPVPREVSQRPRQIKRELQAAGVVQHHGILAIGDARRPQLPAVRRTEDDWQIAIHDFDPVRTGGVTLRCGHAGQRRGGRRRLGGPGERQGQSHSHPHAKPTSDGPPMIASSGARPGRSTVERQAKLRGQKRGPGRRGTRGPQPARAGLRRRRNHTPNHRSGFYHWDPKHGPKCPHRPTRKANGSRWARD